MPPVRDEESETQRKAHAKRVRETRRSTQGVTLEDLKSAEQLVKKKQQLVSTSTVVPGFRVFGFSALPGFRALKAGDGAWSVHKTLFGFKAPILGS